MAMAGGALLAQRNSETPAATSHPILAGIWAPSDPVMSDWLFARGVNLVPGSGRLTIEQRADRFTLTITMPDDQLDPLLSLQGRFYPTIIYHLYESRGRVGGAGAGGAPPTTVPTWVGDRLVIPQPQYAGPNTTATYSLDADRLKLETHVELADGRVNNWTELFAKVK
jgi:hypothetical protein